MKYCTNCGNALSDDAAFCGQCGAAQSTVQQPVDDQTAFLQQPIQTPQAPVAPQQSVYQEPVAPQQPVYQQPAYQEPVAPQQPVYQQPVYQEPVAPQQPVYQQPVYQEPVAPQQPVYQQPVYQEPVVPQQPMYQQPAYAAPKGPGASAKIKPIVNRIGWLAAVLIVVGTVVLNWILPLLTNMRFEKMAEIMADASYNGDYSGYNNLIPKKAFEEKNWDDPYDYIKSAEESFNSDYLIEKYGEGFTYSTKIVGTVKLEKDAEKDAIKRIAEETGIHKSDIKQVRQVAYIDKISGEEDAARPGTFYAYKYKGKWYALSYIGSNTQSKYDYDDDDGDYNDWDY